MAERQSRSSKSKHTKANEPNKELVSVLADFLKKRKAQNDNSSSKEDHDVEGPTARRAQFPAYGSAAVRQRRLVSTVVEQEIKENDVSSDSDTPTVLIDSNDAVYGLSTHQTTTATTISEPKTLVEQEPRPKRSKRARVEVGNEKAGKSTLSKKRKPSRVSLSPEESKK